MLPLGLYLHVPFCRRRCDWCAFASTEGTADSDRWLTLVLAQLAAPPIPEAKWATVYLGGGTPSLLTPGQLDRLLTAVGRNLVPGAEMTFEANPESLQADHLAVLAAHGGTRLSLGIQTFDERLLRLHHRPTRRSHLERARKLIGRWPGALSLDLICGLAGQTASGQMRDLEEALSWEPDHLSFYSLTLEPDTPLAKRAVRGTSELPEEDEASLWWLDGSRRIEAAGLIRYEVSNFARPGSESVHNQRYWALEPWWGLGPSAVSFLPGKEGWEYRTETADLARWLAGEPPAVEVPSRLDLAKDRLLAGLRRISGVPESPWAGLLPETLSAWKGRTVRENHRLFLSAEAFPFLDAFLRDAFAELDERPEFR